MHQSVYSFFALCVRKALTTDRCDITGLDKGKISTIELRVVAWTVGKLSSFNLRQL